ELDDLGVGGSGEFDRGPGRRMVLEVRGQMGDELRGRGIVEYQRARQDEVRRLVEVVAEFDSQHRVEADLPETASQIQSPKRQPADVRSPGATALAPEATTAVPRSVRRSSSACS